VNIDASQVAREPQGNPKLRRTRRIWGMIMPLNLTARFAETIKARERREEYRDAEAKGLILRVTPAGVKTWAVLYSHGGRKRRLTLGEFPAIKLAKARELTLQALADIAQGNDPQGRKVAERRGRVDALSFNRLADRWLERHARVKLKPTAVVEYERMIKADLRPTIGEMAARLITKQDVILKVRDKIAGRGARVHAAHVVGMVSRIYSWAIDEEYVETNPAYKVRKAAVGPSVRDRVLTRAELQSFWAGLDKADMSEALRLILRLAPLTGQRRSEVAGMRECEVKLGERLWVLPGDRVENGLTIHGRTKNRRLLHANVAPTRSCTARSLSMRLFYSVGSPFARVVRIALLETGLDVRVTKQEVTRVRLYSPESEVLAFNPVGRVPTLELDDGTILTESKLILDYIDAFNPGPKLLPRDGSDGWRTLAEMGQARSN
jgi:integrase